MESGQDNNYKRVLECFYQSSLSISDFYLSSTFLKQSQVMCITFGLPLLWERTFENYYIRHRDDEKGSGSLLIEVTCQQGFY